MKHPMNKDIWCVATWIFVAGLTFMFPGPGVSWGNAELPQEPFLPLRLAQKAANAALVKCEEALRAHFKEVKDKWQLN